MIRAQLFYSLLFHLLHITISIITKFITIFTHLTTTSPLHYFSTPSLLHHFNHHEASKLSKIPRHLGLVITEERLDVGRVCEVVVCCLLWGVPSISLYHPTGFLKTRQVEIKREVTRQMKEYINKNNNNKNNNNNNNSKEESSLGRFSMEDGHFNLDDHLFILGGEEGDGMVVRVARTLANKKKNNSNNNNNICYKNNNNNNDNGGGDNNTNYCDNNSNDNRDSLEEVYKTREIMQEMQGFGEAEVILKMGGVCVGLCGYMPWNTRLTEILSVPSHTTITTASLLNTLHSFSSITQRSGV